MRPWQSTSIVALATTDGVPAGAGAANVISEDWGRWDQGWYVPGIPRAGGTYSNETKRAWSPPKSRTCATSPACLTSALYLAEVSLVTFVQVVPSSRQRK